jgi:putative ATPase
VDTLFEDDSGAVSRSRQDARAGGGPAGGRPLAVRMRPATLDGFVGQAHLLGEGSALRTAVEHGNPHSMVLYGPPGCGKTTLARMVAERSNAAFEELSAVQAGRGEVRAVIERAAHRRAANGTRTVFFLDEIHRFNKAQQDALLPAVEEGLVTLIGATTENPAFEVNGALLSRVRVYALAALTAEEVATVLRRAAAAGALEVDEAAIDFLAARTEGDARTALNALELAAETVAELERPAGAARAGVQDTSAGGSENDERAAGEVARVTLARVEDALQRRAVLYDKKGDRHYDYISAWIKATRGSDPDASLYYLAVMLEGGEDPRFIVRRMVILASEDIGNADPGALQVAVAAAHAVEHVGLPEGRYALAQAAIYLSMAPKSDAAGRALATAERNVREHGAAPVPGTLRSGPRPGQDVGGYDNPHDHPGHVSAQELLPEQAAGTRFYEPDDAEAELGRRLEQVRRARAR